MKICVISTAALPSPIPSGGYGGLEQICAWFTQEAVTKGHDVTLITTKGSPWAGTHDIVNQQGNVIAQMNVMETIEPSWDGYAEQNHFNAYKDYVIKEFGDGQGIVIDHTWGKYGYMIARQYPKMKILSMHHGMLGFSTPPDGILFPRMLGLSTYHADLMSSILNIPIRHVHNGIPLPKFEDGFDPFKNRGDYLLSLNRITDEKGIHSSIDVAMATKTPIVIVGDDVNVNKQEYVNQIVETCRHSNGLAQYLGLVDSTTKNQLIAGCKALIACPKTTWQEAFGLYVVEGGAYYKPFIGTSKAALFQKHGYADIIEQGVNGFLADNPEQLKHYVEKIDDIDPNMCRQIVEQKFSKQVMADRYLEIFHKVMDNSPDEVW